MEHIKASYSIFTGMNRFIPKDLVGFLCGSLLIYGKCLCTLQRKYTKHPTTNNFQRLVSAQHSFQDVSRAAKSAYEQSLIQNYATNHDSN